MSGIESRIRNLETVIAGHVDEVQSAEEQRLLYRGLHAHIVMDEQKAETDALLIERLGAVPIIDPNDFRPGTIAYGRALEAAGIPATCDCSFCRPVVGMVAGAAAVTPS